MPILLCKQKTDSRLAQQLHDVVDRPRLGLLHHLPEVVRADEAVLVHVQQREDPPRGHDRFAVGLVGQDHEDRLLQGAVRREGGQPRAEVRGQAALLPQDVVGVQLLQPVVAQGLAGRELPLRVGALQLREQAPPVRPEL